MAICVTQLLSCDSLGLYPARLRCPWDSPGKKTGVGCHAFLQGIFLGIEPESLESPALAGGFLTTSATWKPFGYTSKAKSWVGSGSGR